MKRTIVLLTLLSLTLTLAGCSRNKAPKNPPLSEDERHSVAIVAGVHSNARRINANNDALNDEILNVCKTYGSIAIITADSDPEAVVEARIPEPTVSGLSDTKLLSIAGDYCSQIVEILNGDIIVPDSDEADYFKAITYAASFLQNADSTVRSIYILGTSCGTTGLLDCTKGLLNADPEILVRRLKDAKAIPNLAGIDAVFIGVGQVAGEQSELSSEELYNLKQILAKVCETGGAKSVSFIDSIPCKEVYDGLPHVSAFDTSAGEIDYTPIRTREFGSSEISFKPDSPEFLDERMARDVLEDLAEEIVSKEAKVIICGICAGENNSDSAYRLTEDRAISVMSVLAELGVNHGNMTAIGLASDNGFYIYDRNSDGTLNEGLAEQNRKVIILDERSPDVRKIYR